MKNKKKLYVMCGVPGSGKSTWALEHIPKMEGNTAYVSRDIIRLSKLKDSDDYFSKENEAFAEFIETIRKKIEVCNSVVVDATHITPGARRKLFMSIGASALENVEVIMVVIKVDLETALSQNRNRTGRCLVPDKTITNMYHSFVMPSINEHFIDEVWIYDKGKLTMRREIK